MNIIETELKFVELLRKPNLTVEESQEKERFRIQLENLLNEESASLTSDLNAAGIKCNDVWDLVKIKTPYPNAISILIDHLHRPYHERNKEGIVRALTTKEARGKAASHLIEEYEKTSKDRNDLRWVIGNAIAATMTLKEVEWVYSTVSDKTNGTSRAQLVLALGTINTERSESLLIDLLDDIDVAPQALAALGKLKSRRAKEKILRMRLNTKDSLVRLEATKALKKIG